MDVLHFTNRAAATGDFHVTKVSGHENLSQPFSFQLRMVSARSDFKFHELLAADSTLVIDAGGDGHLTGHAHHIHGVLSSLTISGRRDDSRFEYQAVLVPKVTRLGLGRRSRIFMNMSSTEIIDQILDTDGASLHLAVERRLSGSYAPRDYVVQYQESDFAFLSRLMEHEGIFYYFLHQQDKSTLIIGDHQGAFVDLEPSKTVDLRETAAGQDHAAVSHRWEEPEALRSLARCERMVAAEVVLRDYNDQQPSDTLEVTEQVASAGSFGVAYEYGTHYADSSAGQHYALVRAQELAVQRVQITGTSNLRGVHPGSIFKPTDARSDLDLDLLVLRVDHEAEQTLGDGTTASASYHNRLHAMPSATPFRPERSTPRPVIPGLMNAKIDATEGAEYAHLDDAGRYRVRLPFDRGNARETEASRLIRMAQPYGGSDHGFHFPLHRGTEVVLAHIGGDPDRPIIAAAVPNPETPSPVTAQNASQAVIRTAGANELRIEDQHGSEFIQLHAKKDLKIEAEHDAARSIGNDDSIDVSGKRTVHVVKDVEETFDAKHTVTVKDERTTSIGGKDSLSVGKTQDITVSDSRTTSIDGGDTLTVKKDRSVSVDGAHQGYVKSGYEHRTDGSHTISAKQITIEADSQIVLRTGGASIVMKSSGDILIEGSKVNMKASGDIIVKGAKIAQNG